jgi:hypothetical protein
MILKSSCMGLMLPPGLDSSGSANFGGAEAHPVNVSQNTCFYIARFASSKAQSGTGNATQHFIPVILLINCGSTKSLVSLQHSEQ